MKKIDIDGIEVFVEDNDQYLQINDICDADLSRIWGKIKIDYASYDKWLCYHNTKIPLALLDEIGAVLKDDNIEMRLANNNFNYSEIFGIVRITDENFDEFSVYHNETNPEMYWTSERIRRDLSRWGIFSLQPDTDTAAYILLSMWDSVQSEIYCVEASDRSQCEDLIAYAAKYAFDNSKAEILYMADIDSIGLKAAKAVGFTVTGVYKGYMIKRSK